MIDIVTTIEKLITNDNKEKLEYDKYIGISNDILEKIMNDGINITKYINDFDQIFFKDNQLYESKYTCTDTCKYTCTDTCNDKLLYNFQIVMQIIKKNQQQNNEISNNNILINKQKTEIKELKKRYIKTNETDFQTNEIEITKNIQFNKDNVLFYKIFKKTFNKVTEEEKNLVNKILVSSEFINITNKYEAANKIRDKLINEKIIIL